MTIKKEFDNHYACEEYERESMYDAMFNDSPKSCLTHLKKYITRHLDGLPKGIQHFTMK
jgi:hypothetical protein|nr:MAG TPA: hypothetical protein [Caudoviricetes sp.]